MSFDQDGEHNRIFENAMPPVWEYAYTIAVRAGCLQSRFYSICHRVFRGEEENVGWPVFGVRYLVLGRTWAVYELRRPYRGRQLQRRSRRMRYIRHWAGGGEAGG